jgi:hypothetical protein
VTAELEVDTASGEVVGIATSGLSPMAESLVCSLLSQRKLEEDLPQALEEFKRRYLGIPQKAICSALLNAYDTYKRDNRRNAGGTGRPTMS